jgi:ABC-type nitrate/sulfonate/bicarbonate transport system permease component
MVHSRTVTAVVSPYLIALRTTPLIVVAPLLFLWLGSGLLARALLVTTLTTFPVALASLDGLRSTPEPYLDLARSVDASARQEFLLLRVPAAAPSVFAGVKVAATLSVVGTVVTEFLTLRGGLGARTVRTSTALDTAGMFAALFALALLGLAFYAVPALVERNVHR